MEIATLQAESRQSGGTRAAQRLRRTGKLPAILYGHGSEPETLAIDAHELDLLLDKGVHVVELDVQGEKKQALIKDIQLDHLCTTPIHADFTLVDANERVNLSIPIKLKGEPKGTSEGGLLENSMGDLEIECTILTIPDSIIVDVSGLAVGQSLHASDITLPAGAVLVTPGDAIVCAVRLQAAAVSAADVAPGDEDDESDGPEIITSKQQEDE